MKTLTVLFVTLFSASSLFAQQPPPAPASELSKLRQGYVESLRQLLHQYVQTSDIAAAAAVSQELDRVARAPLCSVPDPSPCGTWSWVSGTTTTITADQMAVNSHHGNRGVWRWLDQSKRVFQIDWQDGWEDQLTISPDGTKAQSVNNQGTRFDFERLLSPANAMTSIAAK